MATLSIRSRRTKANPFPRAVGPLARWRKLLAAAGYTREPDR